MSIHVNFQYSYVLSISVIREYWDISNYINQQMLSCSQLLKPSKKNAFFNLTGKFYPIG